MDINDFPTWAEIESLNMTIFDAEQKSAEQLRSIAAQYRKSAAIIKLRIKEIDSVSPLSIEDKRRKNILAEIVKELRETASMLSHYYDAPRDGINFATSYYAPRVKSHDG